MQTGKNGSKRKRAGGEVDEADSDSGKLKRVKEGKASKAKEDKPKEAKSKVKSKDDERSKSKQPRSRGDASVEGKVSDKAKDAKSAGSAGDKSPKSKRGSHSSRGASAGSKESDRAKEAKNAGSAEENSSKSKKKRRSSHGGASVAESDRPNEDISASATVEKPKRTKQTAICSRGGASVRGRGSDRSNAAEPASPTDEKPPTEKTARSSRGGASAGSRESDRPDVKPSISTEEIPPRVQQMTRGGSSVGTREPDRTSTPVTPTGPMKETPKRPLQTARRGGGFVSGRRRMSDHAEQEEHPQHGLPIPTGPRATHGLPIPTGPRATHGHYSRVDPMRPSESPPLAPLGLINGEYEIHSRDLEEWPEMYPENEFRLALSLSDGTSVWGAYDFGMFFGIMYIPQRPQRASYMHVPFQWRGRERGEGQMSFGPENKGWIRFLGNGRIEGEINCYGCARFSGQRISGRDPRAPRKPVDMQREWHGYNEDAYEHERVERWN